MRVLRISVLERCKSWKGVVRREAWAKIGDQPIAAYCIEPSDKNSDQPFYKLVPLLLLPHSLVVSRANQRGGCKPRQLKYASDGGLRIRTSRPEDCRPRKAEQHERNSYADKKTMEVYSRE